MFTRQVIAEVTQGKDLLQEQSVHIFWWENKVFSAEV